MTTYVKAKGSSQYHWCKNCSDYPSSSNIASTRATRPDGYLCDQCRAKERNNNCTEWIF